MYNITRQEASLVLNMSTRNIDRYIKSGKLRSKKDGKIIYLNSDDVDKMRNKGVAKREIILGKNIVKNEEITNKEIARKSDTTEFIYADLKELIKQKDKKIEDLTYAVGKLEENLKNSITMIEFKKSQFLLEQSRESLEKDLEIEKEKNKDLENKLSKENKINLFLISASAIIFILLVLVWFIKV